ncbi:hypothetical protein LXL04_015640 [Taraxacum kok-saghyz]
MERMLKAARASGSLNLSNRSLKSTKLDLERKYLMRYTRVWMQLAKVKIGGSYSILQVFNKPSFVYYALELQKLILAHNEIELLKEDIRNLPMLSVLNISHNKLSHLPAAIGELKSLKALDVSSNLLREIPEEIGSVTSLIKHQTIPSLACQKI